MCRATAFRPCRNVPCAAATERVDRSLGPGVGLDCHLGPDPEWPVEAPVDSGPSEAFDNGVFPSLQFLL